jgi:trk system potassium uptake protein TrkA
MKIIILGAGRVGYSVAESLVSEKNDITVIDTDHERLRALESRFDLRGVLGSGIDPQVLAEAGARDTELLIACASLDETNLVCCKLAQIMFGIPTRIARVHSPAFALEHETHLLGKDGFGVDCLICPEESLTNYISKLIEYPEAMQVRAFADDRAALAAVRARAGAPAVGLSIADIRARMPDLDMRVVAIYRLFPDAPDRFVRCAGETRIEPGDEVFILAASARVAEALRAFNRPEGQASRPVSRIMIAGGSQVSLRLACKLMQAPGRFHIKIIERGERQCLNLSAALPSQVLVLQGDATDENLLGNEGIDDVDMFLALTADDQTNIMSTLLAKRMGARRVLALVDRRAYADLVHGTQIDIALTPAQAMLGELLAHVRRGDVQAVHSLRRGVAEALEIVARGDRKSSRVVGRKVQDLRLPDDVHIGLIVRGMHAGESLAGQPGEPAGAPEGGQKKGEVIIPRSHTTIESGDHVVFFLPDKRLVRDVENLFRVSATFF